MVLEGWYCYSKIDCYGWRINLLNRLLKMCFCCFYFVYVLSFMLKMLSCLLPFPEQISVLHCNFWLWFLLNFCFCMQMNQWNGPCPWTYALWHLWDAISWHFLIDFLHCCLFYNFEWSHYQNGAKINFKIFLVNVCALIDLLFRNMEMCGFGMVLTCFFVD